MYDGGNPSWVPWFYGPHPYPQQGNRTFLKDNISTVTVEGKGHVTVQPDQAKMTIGVVTENQNVNSAQQENAVLSNQLVESLKSLGIDEAQIRTTAYNIQPQYDFTEGKSVLRGYQVEHFLEVTVKDLSKAGSVYEVAVRNGANRTGSIELFVSNPDAYYREALKKAVINAKGNAEAITDTIGATLNNVPVKVIEKVEHPRGISPLMSFKTVEGTVQQTPQIQTGELTISAFVTAKFEYQE